MAGDCQNGSPLTTVPSTLLYGITHFFMRKALSRWPVTTYYTTLLGR